MVVDTSSVMSSDAHPAQEIPISSIAGIRGDCFCFHLELLSNRMSYFLIAIKRDRDSRQCLALGSQDCDVRLTIE
jgi:hypothetical protein